MSYIHDRQATNQSDTQKNSSLLPPSGKVYVKQIFAMTIEPFSCCWSPNNNFIELYEDNNKKQELTTWDLAWEIHDFVHHWAKIGNNVLVIINIPIIIVVMLQHFSSFLFLLSRVLFLVRRFLFSYFFMINLPLIDRITNASKAHLTSFTQKIFRDIFFALFFLWILRTNRIHETQPLSQDILLDEYE